MADWLSPHGAGGVMQEPGSSKEIKAFASRQGATFPLMAKIDVNGVGQSPLFAFLKQNQGERKGAGRL